MSENAGKKRSKEGLPHLVVTASGPGELSGLVRPLLEEIHRQRRPWHISIWLWKSAFSVGTEQEVISRLPGGHRVYLARGNLCVLALGDSIAALKAPGPPRALLHMGGEPIFSLLLARRLRCPALVYSEGRRIRSHRGFRKVFLSEKPAHASWRMIERSGGRYLVVGSLFVDALNGVYRKTGGQCRGSNGKKITIGLFPGSRPYQVRYMAPFFLFLSRRVAKKIENAQFLFAKSEYLSHGAFMRLMSRKRSGTSRDFHDTRMRDQDCSIPEGANKGIPILSSEEVFARSDMVVMLPGTCTAEGMLMGIPMVVLAPYYRLGSNPSPGVPVYMDAILGMMGKCLKQKIMLAVLKRFTFFSHPNLKAGREVVPELRGWIRPFQVVNTVERMARDEKWRAQITEDLKRLAGPPGASKAVVEALRPFMEKGH